MGARRVLASVATSRPVARLRRLTFRGSGRYWEARYAKGGSSGSGSQGEAARWKADVVNGWVRELGVTSIVDLGCGDGSQLALADYPRYLGLDRSPTAVRMCMQRFRDVPTMSFLRYDPDTLADPAGWLKGDMALSMEVIFHLVEDDIFRDYMTRLFSSGERFVVICSNDSSDEALTPHERHRVFTAWVAAERPEWVLSSRVDPPVSVGLMSSMYLYSRSGAR